MTEKNTANPHALFSTFVMGLASAALMEMGVIDDPQTKKKQVRLEVARQHVDLLDMLVEKTRGNLTDEEKGILTRVVTDLKLQFLKVSQKPTTENK